MNKNCLNLTLFFFFIVLSFSVYKNAFGKDNYIVTIVNKIPITKFDIINRAKLNKKLTMRFLNKRKSEGKSILLYGASTKGNTLLQYYGIDSKLIPYAAERSPEKWNKFTVGSGIKIISEKKSQRNEARFFSGYTMGFY